MLPQIPVMLTAGSVENFRPDARHQGDTPIDLLRVSYGYQLTTPYTELPICMTELHLYIRFVLEKNNDRRLSGRKLGLTIWEYQMDEWVAVRSGETNPEAPFVLGDVPFRFQVSSRHYVVRDVEVPRTGIFLLSLLLERRKPNWRGQSWIALASTQIEIR
jgi:hypothetical protein